MYFKCTHLHAVLSVPSCEANRNPKAKPGNVKHFCTTCTDWKDLNKIEVKSESEILAEVQASVDKIHPIRFDSLNDKKRMGILIEASRVKYRGKNSNGY